MFNFKLHLPCGWLSDRPKWMDWFDFTRTIRLTKHKSCEIEFAHWGFGDLIHIDLRLMDKTDHAGFYSTFTVIGFTIFISVADNRHWNDETNEWEEYDEGENIKTF